MLLPGLGLGTLATQVQVRRCWWGWWCWCWWWSSLAFFSLRCCPLLRTHSISSPQFSCSVCKLSPLRRIWRFWMLKRKTHALVQRMPQRNFGQFRAWNPWFPWATRPAAWIGFTAFCLGSFAIHSTDQSESSKPLPRHDTKFIQRAKTREFLHSSTVLFVWLFLDFFCH